MKIKNIKVTENLKRLVCVPLVGLIMATSLAGCDDEPKIEEIVSYEDYDDKIFDAGEHIISIPIDDPTQETVQYESHEGYKPIGISTSAYGRYGYNYGNGKLLFVNEYPVKCNPTYKKGEELLYTEFGKPVEYEKETTKSGDNWQEFNPGEHIISVPLKKDSDDNTQYECYEGYEPIGMASSAYGRYGYRYGGGCILYTNTEKVKCIKDENGTYTSFGIPEEDTKVLQK